MEVVAAKWLQSTDLQTYTLVSSHTPLQRPARTNQLTLKFKVTKKTVMQRRKHKERATGSPDRRIGFINTLKYVLALAG